MAKPSDQRCCTDSRCESGLKNHYFAGKRLTADSLRVEQEYQIERRRLLNRAIHGWGVVYGYGIGAAPPGDCHEGSGTGRLRIGAGLALDRCGRELLQVGTRTIALDEVIFVDARGKKLPREEALQQADDEKVDRTKPPPRRCWLLSVHYAEEHHGTVKVSEPCSCERQEHDHVCETVRYTLRQVACEECCRDWPCELECKCAKCCGERPVDEHVQAAVAAPPPGDDEYVRQVDPQRLPKLPPVHELPPDRPPRRGGCRCLCDHLIGLELCGKCGLCKVEDPCGEVWVDLAHGVPLACVELARDQCDSQAFGTWIEPCGPRRLVKRNDLLFDLIRGCDLTRISEIGWADWHRSQEPVPFEHFSAAFGRLDGPNAPAPVTERYRVTFSRPVRESTLRPDCFAMTVMSQEREGGWWQAQRVPIVDLDIGVVPREKDDPDGHVRGAELVVDEGWLWDAVRGPRNLFMGCVTRIEIEVRGDFIVDCNGQAIDANAQGLSPAPTGNGTPGGTFLSTFLVEPAPAGPARPASYRTESSRKGASS